MRDAAANLGIDVDIWYLTLLATDDGLASVRATGLFDNVESLSILDATYRVFGGVSQYFIGAPSSISKWVAESVMKYYGGSLVPGDPLGYGDCQLLLGFQHNVPDNTLPIIWAERTLPLWHPIFLRRGKIS